MRGSPLHPPPHLLARTIHHRLFAMHFKIILQPQLASAAHKTPDGSQTHQFRTSKRCLTPSPSNNKDPRELLALLYSRIIGIPEDVVALSEYENNLQYYVSLVTPNHRTQTSGGEKKLSEGEGNAVYV